MKPTTCGHCGAPLAKVAGRDERWDIHPGVWVGFLDCPACGQAYVYIRPGAPPRSVDPQPSENTP